MISHTTQDASIGRSKLAGQEAKQAEVTARLHELEKLDNADLRDEWRRLYRVPPPKRIRRELLLLAIAYRIQEQALGGLSTATKRRLAALADEGSAADQPSPRKAIKLKPGTKLVRSWQGKTHTVTVTEDGFLWNGRTWRSLSKIACEITGSHWSGPRFFGLTDKRTAADTGGTDG